MSRTGNRPHRRVTPYTPVDATGTVRRLRALVAFGYPRSYLAERLKMERAGVNTLLGAKTRVLAKTACEVEDLFNELQQVPGPSGSARGEARNKGWPVPFAWDEDLIDNPDAHPYIEKSTRKTVRFSDRYAEMRELGYSDLLIADKWKVKPGSLLRQILRYGFTPDRELVREADHRRKYEDQRAS